MLEKLFDNPGSTIKSLAKAFFLIEAVALIILSLVFLYNGQYIYFVSCLLGGLSASYFTNLLIYGFGELIETTAALHQNNRPILVDTNKQTTAPIPVPAPIVKAAPAEAKPAPAPVASAKAPAPAAEKSVTDVLAYAAKFSTPAGARSHLQRQRMLTTDPAAISVYNEILAYPDESIKDVIKKYL